MQQHKIKLHPYQKTVLQSNKKFIFVGAGVGAGKTFFGALWALNKILRTDVSKGLIASNSYTQMFDTTVVALYKLFDDLGIIARPRRPPRSHRPFEVEVSVNGAVKTILFRSLESYENISGIEVDWFWLDEVWQTNKDALDVVFARLRGKSEKLQGLLTTTLDDPACWLYECFVTNYDPKIMDVIYATTYENPNLPEGYIDGLKSSYSERLFERMVLAKWVALESDVIYYNFDRKLHVCNTLEYEPRLPLLLSFDFNIGVNKPASLIMAQMGKSNGKPCLHVLNELVVQGLSTDQILYELKEKYRTTYDLKHCVIYGDATGKARDSTSNRSDYDIIVSSGFTNLRVPSINPPVRYRHNIMNSLLKNVNGETVIKIHPNCKMLIRGMELTKLKKGAAYIEDDSDSFQHVTTALGYLCCVEFTLPNSNRLTKFSI